MKANAKCVRTSDVAQAVDYMIGSKPNPNVMLSGAVTRRDHLAATSHRAADACEMNIQSNITLRIFILCKSTLQKAFRGRHSTFRLPQYRAISQFSNSVYRGAENSIAKTKFMRVTVGVRS
jgi:hypothetical protein